MKKEEAKRLRDIADVLDDQYYHSDMDGTNQIARWCHWGAEEIRKVVSDSGFNAFNDEKCGTTTTKEDNTHEGQFNYTGQYTINRF